MISTILICKRTQQSRCVVISTSSFASHIQSSNIALTLLFACFVFFLLTGETHAYILKVVHLWDHQGASKQLYGTLPNKATDFDPDWFEKRERELPWWIPRMVSTFLQYQALCLGCCPWEDIVQHLWIPRTFCTIKVVEDFEVGTILKGDYAGFLYTGLKETYGRQKGRALSLKKPVLNAKSTRKI